MDSVLVNVYRLMVSRFRCSAEDIVEDPDLRNTFLEEVRKLLADAASERQILHRLSYLRKQRKLPRLRDLVCAPE